MSKAAAKRDVEAVPDNQQPHPESVLREQIGRQNKLFASLLGSDDRGVARFMASAWQAIRANPRLLAANRASLLMALGEAAALGLSVNPSHGEFWLIPRKSKDMGGEEIVDGQTGYRGLMKLARRAGDVRFHVAVVRRGDLFKEVGGTDPRIIHEPCWENEPDGYDDDQSIIAAYAVAWEQGSPDPQFTVVRLAKLFDAAVRSGNPYEEKWSNVWCDHFEAQCKKTALARLSKLLTRSDDLKTAVGREEQRAAGNDPGVLVEQLRDLLKPQAAVTAPSGLEGVIGLPMPDQDQPPDPSE